MFLLCDAANCCFAFFSIPNKEVIFPPRNCNARREVLFLWRARVPGSRDDLRAKRLQNFPFLRIQMSQKLWYETQSDEAEVDEDVSKGERQRTRDGHDDGV